jgi:outer membrane protein assembly factor BamB
LVDNQLLLIATSGRTLVLSADPALEEIARMELGDKVHASPAMLHGRLYVRGEEHLYAIGSVDFHDPGSLLTHSHGN